MLIYIDADSCPVAVRETIIRACRRTGITGIFVANRPIPGVHGYCIEMELCPTESGAADDRIVEKAEPGDIVITRDIPLAARLVEKQIAVIDDRGTLYTSENIKERLSVRDFFVSLSDNGLGMARINSYGKKELKAFADGFDRALTMLRKK